MQGCRLDLGLQLTIRISVGRTWAAEKSIDLFCKNEFFEFHFLNPSFTKYLMNGPTKKAQTFRGDRSHISKQKVPLGLPSKMHASIGKSNPIG